VRGVEIVAIHNAPMDPGPPEALRILVVEDDRALRAVLVSATEAAGYEVVAVGDGLAAARELRARPYDVVLLDIGLPVVDGWHILGELEGRRIPSVIVISARGEERDKVRALDLGADDYLGKPFAFTELVARVQALARRAPAAPPVVTRGDLVVDRARRRATRSGRPVALTRKEFGVLEMLVAADGGVVSAEELLEHVWDANADPFSNTVSVTISRLRRKLGSPALVETVVGSGYRLCGQP